MLNTTDIKILEKLNTNRSKYFSEGALRETVWPTSYHANIARLDKLCTIGAIESNGYQCQYRITDLGVYALNQLDETKRKVEDF
jgi:hypothetical protein